MGRFAIYFASVGKPLQQLQDLIQEAETNLQKEGIDHTGKPAWFNSSAKVSYVEQIYHQLISYDNSSWSTRFYHWLRNDEVYQTIALKRLWWTLQVGKAFQVQQGVLSSKNGLLADLASALSPNTPMLPAWLKIIGNLRNEIQHFPWWQTSQHINDIAAENMSRGIFSTWMTKVKYWWQNLWPSQTAPTIKPQDKTYLIHIKLCKALNIATGNEKALQAAWMKLTFSLRNFIPTESTTPENKLLFEQAVASWETILVWIKNTREVPESWGRTLDLPADLISSAEDEGSEIYKSLKPWFAHNEERAVIKELLMAEKTEKLNKQKAIETEKYDAILKEKALAEDQAKKAQNQARGLTFACTALSLESKTAYEVVKKKLRELKLLYHPDKLIKEYEDENKQRFSFRAEDLQNYMAKTAAVFDAVNKIAEKFEKIADECDPLAEGKKEKANLTLAIVECEQAKRLAIEWVKKSQEKIRLEMERKNKADADEKSFQPLKDELISLNNRNTLFKSLHVRSKTACQEEAQRFKVMNPIRKNSAVLC